MSNQVTLTEPLVDTRITEGWTGLELWHGPTELGPFTLLTVIPYIAAQTTYVYIDSGGLLTDWYEDRRYAPGPVYSSFSAAWTDTAPTGQITLALIEQTTAMRVGPYRQEAVTSAPNNTLILFDTLKSSIDLGQVTDLFVLRRGLLDTGIAVPGYVSSDRVRLAKGYVPNLGQVEVDRPYTTAPVAGELVEFHHLEPMQELRRSVLAGLARCWFMDRATVTLAGAAAERDLTSSAFWITNPRQVYRAHYGPYNALQQPREVAWPHVFQAGNHVWLAAAPDPLPYGLLVSARRPHSTWVNGADSTTGPELDSDTLSIDLDYAVSAAHVEAWRLARPRLQAVGAQHLYTSLQEAAAEFTAAAASNFKPPARRVVLSAPFGSDSGRRPLSLTTG